jgi:threonine synthase
VTFEKQIEAHNDLIFIMDKDAKSKNHDSTSQRDRLGMQQTPPITSSVVNFIGDTPIMKLEIELNSQIYPTYATLEFMNPSGSVKDIIAKFMIESAEKRGILNGCSRIMIHRNADCWNQRMT